MSAEPEAESSHRHHKKVLTADQFHEYTEIAAFYVWLARGEGEEKIPGNAQGDWKQGEAEIGAGYRVCDPAGTADAPTAVS